MIKEFNPYSLKDLKKDHGVITYLILSESGKFRSGGESGFDDDQCIHVCPKPEMVEALMKDLSNWKKIFEYISIESELKNIEMSITKP